MPYLPTAQEWLTQSALLLEARPTTTRITAKYTLSKPTIKVRTSRTIKSDHPAALEQPPPTGTIAATRATLTLKTYNPASGVTLKYKTDKAAEVGRLISSLARLGRSMAGLPEVRDDVSMLDTQGVEGNGTGVGAAEIPSSGAATLLAEKGNPVGAGQQQQQGGGGQGGKKGKKKGKK